jgi:hypothetical protein
MRWTVDQFDMFQRQRKRKGEPQRYRTYDPAELEIHISLVARCRLQVPKHVLWYHIPNGELREDAAGAKLRAMGTLAGAGDLFFQWRDPFPDGEKRSLYLELKSRTGRLSEDQKQFRDRAIAAGAEYAVANSIDEAVNVLIGCGLLPAERTTRTRATDGEIVVQRRGVG